jgi:prenylcysteine oxidase/farnesylcysteine lyase
MKFLWKYKSLFNRKKKPAATPLPKLKLFVIGSMVIINRFGESFIFPFLPFMVHDFFPQLSKEELGQKAGFLGSANFAGNFFGNLLWGWISDRWGRRPVMLTAVAGVLFAQLMFGFSFSFGWAICARILWGFMNTTFGIAKTYLSEICDDTNQAQAFAVLGTAAGFGRLLGSIIGGYLAQPASKYTALQYDFFCQFPYVFPVFVANGIGLMSFICMDGYL